MYLSSYGISSDIVNPISPYTYYSYLTSKLIIMTAETVSSFIIIELSFQTSYLILHSNFSTKFQAIVIFPILVNYYTATIVSL